MTETQTANIFQPFVTYKSEGTGLGLAVTSEIMAAFSLYFGFTSEGVDNAAHVGGLLCGFILAVLLYHPSRKCSGHISERQGR